MRVGRESGQTNTNEIVRLCEEYSITSEYASFIVLENDAEYRRWKIQRRNANRVRRDRAARERLNVELAQLRDRSMQQIGPVQSLDVQTPTQQIASVDSAASNSTTRNSLPRSTPSRTNRRSRGFDIPTPNRADSGPRRGGGGGGAIDPISGSIALGLAGAAAAAARRRRTKRDRKEAIRERADV
jgi:hypothetical protein